MSLRTVAVIVALFGVGCRHPSEGQSDVAEANEEADKATFLEGCRSVDGMPPVDQSTFRVLLANYTLADTPVHFQGGVGTFIEPSQTESDCEKLWPKFKAKPEFFVTIPRNGSLDVFRMMSVFPGTTIALTVPNLPKHFEVLKTLQLVSLGIAAQNEDSDFSDAERETVLKTLKEMPNLKGLSFTDISMPNLDSLRDLKNIEDLSVRNGGLSDLSFLAEWQQLRALAITKNNVSDLSFLKDSLNLEILLASDNSITSIDPLMFAGNLKEVAIDRNKKPLPGILALKYLANLRNLSLESSGVKNLDALKNLPLRILNVRNNPVESIEALSGSGINELYLSGTQVKDITPAATMPKLGKLTLARTPVTMFPKFPDGARLRILDIEGTAIANLCDIYKMPNLTNLRLPSGQFLEQKEIKDAQCSP